LNLLRAATLCVRDPEATAARYAAWMDYRILERGTIEADAARAWSAPAVEGRSYVVCGPASGAEVYIRFVQADPPPDYRPLRSFGWAAIEICVQDTLAVAQRLAASPFDIIGPPRTLDGLSDIYPMQVRGPDDEIVYLTQIRAQPPGERLAVAESFIDRLFILVLACSDLTCAQAWLSEQLGLVARPTIALRYTMLSKAFDLPIEEKHHIATGGHEQDTFLEFDQYPPAATPRPRRDGDLPPGVALVTLEHPDLDGLRIAWLSAPKARRGLIYGGRRTGLVRGPDGALIELIARD
jgi:hypothetical protein